MIDLIARLRLQSEHIPVQTLFDDAADCIEELECDYKDACNEAANCYIKQCVAEAKLAKAIEALRDIMSFDDIYPWRKARAVLAELERKE